MTLEIQQTNPADRAVSCLLAETPEGRQMAFRMRHDCYLRGGYIEANAAGEFRDPFDDQENHFTFIAQQQGRQPLGTVRISVVRKDEGWRESPASHVFSDVPRFQDILRQSYVEASRLCFPRQARRDVLMKLLGNMAAMAEYFQVGWLVACPRSEHSAIYQRLFGLQPIAPARQYFGVKFQTQLLAVRRELHQEYVRFNRPMLAAWTEAYQKLKSQRICV